VVKKREKRVMEKRMASREVCRRIYTVERLTEASNVSVRGYGSDQIVAVDGTRESQAKLTIHEWVA
jgi:hypothetical protein